MHYPFSDNIFYSSQIEITPYSTLKNPVTQVKVQNSRPYVTFLEVDVGQEDLQERDDDAECDDTKRQQKICPGLNRCRNVNHIMFM